MLNKKTSTHISVGMTPRERLTKYFNTMYPLYPTRILQKETSAQVLRLVCQLAGISFYPRLTRRLLAFPINSLVGGQLHLPGSQPAIGEELSGVDILLHGSCHDVIREPNCPRILVDYFLHLDI
jgi:hypothetical protein